MPTTARKKLCRSKPFALCRIHLRPSTEVAQAQFLPSLHGPERANDELAGVLPVAQLVETPPETLSTPLSEHALSRAGVAHA